MPPISASTLEFREGSDDVEMSLGSVEKYVGRIWRRALSMVVRTARAIL
jgi:hypothetical protein